MPAPKASVPHPLHFFPIPTWWKQNEAHNLGPAWDYRATTVSRIYGDFDVKNQVRTVFDSVKPPHSTPLGNLFESQRVADNSHRLTLIYLVALINFYKRQVMGIGVDMKYSDICTGNNLIPSYEISAHLRNGQ